MHVVRSLLAASLAVWLVAPIEAHHSFAAQYDREKTITLNGTVTRLEWMNPHVYFYMDVKDEGGVAKWAIEGGAPTSLYRAGWRKDSLKVGETVTVTGNRAKNPASPNVGQATILNSAGKRIYSGQNEGAAATP